MLCDLHWDAELSIISSSARQGRIPALIGNIACALFLLFKFIFHALAFVAYTDTVNMAAVISLNFAYLWCSLKGSV